MRLEARGLAFGYAGRPVGHDLDLSVDDGRVLCILGPNGAGKTTLFRTLLGLLPPLAGDVRLDGRDIRSLPRHEIARMLAYVPQISESPFDFTVLDVVEMGRVAHLGLFARPSGRDRERCLAALEVLGISALAERPLASLSGGERQLALIARALATEARIVVMDEPTASLDFGNQARVLGEIARLSAAGISVLLCSHDPAHAFQVAQRALLLQKGRSLAQGAVDDVLTDDNLSRLYGIPVKIAARLMMERA